jgi:flagellar basal-body rod modification protein FlgD
MSGTTTSTYALQNAANAAAAGLTGASNGSASGSSGTGSSGNALASLTGNFNNFLSLLTTQLQNQDPSSPMDTNQFTTELVQFAGVEQQISTNTSLTQLIQLTQGDAVVQSSQLLGREVEVSGNQLTLQHGSAQVNFTAPTAGPVAIAVYNSAGQQIYDTTIEANSGANTWTWNGATGAGGTAPDGAYTVAAVAAGSDGATQTLTTTTRGTVTGVQQQGSTVQLQLGSLTTSIGSLVSVSN